MEQNINKNEKETNVEKTYNVNSEDALLVLNKYVLLNDDKKYILLDLDGNKSDEIICDDLYYFDDESDAYFANGKNVYKLDNGKFKEICNLEGNNYGFLKNAKDKIIGIYDSLNSKEIIYLKDKNEFKKSEIYNYTVGSGLSEKNYKDIYNNRYIIIVKLNTFGVYDLNENKELIEPKYEKIEYLNGDYFAIMKDDKYGSVDKNEKVILDFDYDKINYIKDLYFAIRNDTLKVLDSKLKEIISVEDVNYSTNRLKLSVFGDKVIYLANRAIAVDNKGTLLELDFDDF